MNGTQQQQVLAALVSASSSLGAAARVLGGSGGACGAITVPSLYLDFLPDELRNNPRDFFVYSPPDFLTIAAGATATGSFQVESDSDFLLVDLTGFVNDPADEVVFPFAQATVPMTIQINDTGSGRNLFNRAQAWNNVIGTGQLTFYASYPKFFPATANVTTTLLNNDPTQALRVRLSFIGFKIFGMMAGGA